MRKIVTFFVSLVILLYQMPTFCYAFPTLATPSSENVSAGTATLVLQSSDSGTGYFTLQPGNSTACGTGTQVKAGQNSSGSPVRYRGSMTLSANTPARYTVRNLQPSSAYTVCFTADSPTGQNLQEQPATNNLATSAAVSLTDKEWKAVGNTGFSAGQASYISQAFAPDGTPYIAYSDGGNGGKVTVMKYVSGSWSVVGSAGFSANPALGTALAFAPNGTLYVAYQSLSSNNSPIMTLMAFGGTTWSSLGTAGSGQNSSLAFAPNGDLYIVFSDPTYAGKVSVRKYSNGWSQVGNAGFSSGVASATSIAIASDGTPYVAYHDSGNPNRITAKRFLGSWNSEGTYSSYVGAAGFTKLALSPDNTAYVAFQGVSGRATVARWSGGAPSLTTFGTVSTGTVTDVSLAIAPDGTPVVAFQDLNNGNKATALKFYSGTGWSELGNSGFSSVSASPVSLAFAPDGRPYVAYGDGATGKVTVMRLDISDTTTTVSADKGIASTGESVTFTATISKSAATGTVAFMEGTTLLGTVSISNGIATFSTSALPVGYHTITAVYAGDSNFVGSTSVGQQVEIRPVGFVVISAISSPVSGISTGLGVSFSGINIPLPVSGTAASVDGDSIKQVEVSIDGGTTWRLASGTINWNISLMFPVEGVFTIKSRATTTAGVVETPAAGISIIIDRTPPTGNIVSAVLNDANLLTIALNTRANTPGMGCLDYLPIVCGYQDITLSYDGVAWTPWQQAMATKQYSITMVGQQKTVYAKLRDNAGNISAVLSAPVQGGVCGSAIHGYFSIAPTDSLCSTGTASAVSGSNPWSWSCSNPIGGVSAACSASKAVGLVYSSSNAGIDWIAGKSGFGYNESISSVILSPDYSNDHTLFMTGKNLYRSTDNGNSWTQIRFGWNPQMMLAVSPAYVTDRTLFFGQFNGGIFKNTDGSTSWTTLNTGLANLMVQSLALSPAFTSDTTLFTGLYNSGVYKSTDSGVTWQPANTGIEGLSPFILAVSPTYTDDQTIFAVTTDGSDTDNGPHHHVYKSTDGGGNWNVSDTGLTGPFTSLAVSPSYVSDRTLFVSTANGINKSTDGGVTWTLSYAANLVSSIVFSPGYASDQTLFAANGSDVLTSINGGDEWSITNQNFTAGALLRALAISPDFTSDHRMFAATSLVGPFPSVTPSLSFGNVKRNNTSEILKITIANPAPGDSSLIVSGISLWGDNSNQFSIASGSCGSLTPVLAAGAACTIDVTFSPTYAGVANAYVTVSTNATAFPPGKVTLKGIGVSVTSTISTPASGITTGSPLNVMGTAGCSYGDVVSLVEVSIDNGSTWFPATGTTSWNADLQFPLDGTFSIKSRATTNAGIVETPTVGISVTIDRTAPTGSILSAVLNDTNSLTIALNTRANDPGLACLDVLPLACGYQEITLSYDGSTWTPWVQASARQQYAITMVGQQKTVYAKLRDSVGNVSEVLSAPVMTSIVTSVISSPATGYATKAASVSLSGTATSVVYDPVQLVEVSVDGGATWQPATGTTAWSIDLSFLREGNFTIKSRATTRSGIIETPSAGISIAIDRTAPTGAIISAVYKDGSSLTVGLNANAHDPDTVCIQIYPAPICGYMEISLSYNGINWTPWQEASTTRQYNIATADLPGTVYARLRDSVGNVSTVLNAQVQYIGVCGSAIIERYSSAPTTDLCSGGEPSTVTGIGPWRWNCSGLNNGSTVNCSAAQAGGVVYRSSDAGVTWTAGKTGIDLNTGAKPLLVSPNYASDHTLFLGADGIYRSTDSGDTWTKTLSGYMVQAFAVSPAYVNDRTVFAGTFLSGVYKSTDGGSTWSPSNIGLTPTMVFSLAISPVFSSDHTIFAGNSGGIYKSTDGGASWFTANSGTTNVAALSLAISPAFASDQTIFAATSSYIYKSSDGGSSWALSNSGISGSVNALRISPGYASDQTLFAATSTGVYKSTDKGANWAKVNNGNFGNAMALSPNYTSDQTLFAGMFGVNVFNSTDGGGTWSASNSDFAVSNPLASLSVSPTFASDHTVFAVTTLAAPVMSLSTYNLAFNQIKSHGSPLTKQISISNGVPDLIGIGNLAISGISLTGTNANEFSIAPGTCGSLTPIVTNGGQCNFDVTFSPTSTGSKNATLEIVSNSFGHYSTTVNLTGTGITATSSISIPTSGFITNTPSVSVSGTADCTAGDSVSLVEVSADDGITWQLATGTSSWSIDLSLPVFGSYSIVTRATTSGGIVETPGSGITIIRSPVVGVCGEDSGKILSALAPTKLCDKGTPSEISGNGHPWIWTCQSDTGIEPIPCSASIQTYSVSVTVAEGSGTGDVSADTKSNDDPPSSMFCPKSLCIAHYDFGKIVRLTATPSPISLFSSWAGDCTDEPCNLEMTSNKAVTVNFYRAHSFKNITRDILDNNIENLMESALPSDEIRMLAADLSIRPLILNKSLTLTGGWDGHYQSPADTPTTLSNSISIRDSDSVIINTTIKGLVSIQGRSLKVDRVTIMP